ncbi:MAG: hypothetical protein V7776_12210 [Halopseudomonas aestusnigri]
MLPDEKRIIEVSKTDKIGLHFRPRIYLALYMALAGYFTSNLLGELIFSLKHSDYSFTFDLSLLWPSDIKDFLILGTYFLPSYYLLPPRLSQKSFQGGKAFWGGALAFFVGSLIQVSYSAFRISYYLHQATKTSLENEYPLPLTDLLISVAPTLIIISLIIAPIGGFFSWLGYRFLYARRDKYWLQNINKFD